MKFIWRKWKTKPGPSTDLDLGHGLCIYDHKRKSRNRLIGFVDGYKWYHGDSDTVVIYTIEPDRVTTPTILKQVRQILEEGLKLETFPHGKVTSRIEIIANA